MKRFNNLYSKVYDLDNIRLAHLNARKGKAHYKEVIQINSNPEYYFNLIQEMLKNKTFKNSRYSIFHKFDGVKQREIYKLPYFPDRIIHHCIMQIVEPIWKKTLINDTYSSIKERGIHKGVKRIKFALRDLEGTKYCLKLDIAKYYPSVDHDILKSIIKNKIKDKDLLWLLDEIINSAPGIPIGNYLSQYFANLYLSGFDHWIKEDLRIKYYFRYCDDMTILSDSKAKLHSYLDQISDYLITLKLKIKDNYRIFPVTTGIDFLGYVFFPKYALVRKRIRSSCIKMLKSNSVSYVCRSLSSYFGWFIHSNSYNLRKRLITFKMIESLNDYCKENSLKNPIMRFI